MIINSIEIIYIYKLYYASYCISLSVSIAPCICMGLQASYRIIDNKNNGFKYEATKKNVKDTTYNE